MGRTGTAHLLHAAVSGETSVIFKSPEHLIAVAFELDLAQDFPRLTRTETLPIDVDRFSVMADAWEAAGALRRAQDYRRAIRRAQGLTPSRSGQRYPSVDTLETMTGHGGRPMAIAARKILDGRTTVENARSLKRATREEKLRAVDTLVMNHGVEWLAFECDRFNYEDPQGFRYSNTGDTYAATLVLYEGNFRVTSYGDMVEAHERRCRVCGRERQAADDR